MTDSDTFEWEETVELAVAALEKQTGLKLAGLSRSGIINKVMEWRKTKQQEKS
jgi:hypothetical protein